MNIFDLYIITSDASTENRGRIINAMPASLRGHAIPVVTTYQNVDEAYSNSNGMSNDAAAIKMAHLSALYSITQSQNEVALIVEDRTHIPDHFYRALQSITERLPTDFDIVYLSHHKNMHLNVSFPNIGPVTLTYCDSNSRAHATDSPSLLRAHRVWGAPAYLVSRIGARKILDLSQMKNPNITFNLSDGLGSIKTYRFSSTDFDQMLLCNLHELEAYLSWPMIADNGPIDA